MNDNHARLSPALVETTAGFFAGTISTLAVHPLDVIKTRLQIHRSTSNAPISSFSIFKALISNERPIQSLYRGITPNLIGNASSWAIFFYFKSTIEKQLLLFHNHRSPKGTFTSVGNNHASPGTPPQAPRTELTPVDYFLASGISGVMITLSTNPIWVLKTRMLSSDKGAQGAYSSMWQGARQLWNIEGIKGFYRGVGISLLGNSHGAVQFAVYEPMKNIWRRYLAREREWDHEAASAAAAARRADVLRGGDGNVREDRLGTSATLVISGSAKIVAGTVTYPYQVVRSRLQTYDAEERFGRGISGVASKVWREEGWRGFYRGLGTNIVRVLPATWVTFLVYENVRYFLPLWVGG